MQLLAAETLRQLHNNGLESAVVIAGENAHEMHGYA